MSDSKRADEEISIHASRVGGDVILDVIGNICGISIHASRVGGDVVMAARLTDQRKFQSTPPGWEATAVREHTVRGSLISIHASRVGGDENGYFIQASPPLFQSTPPGWEATNALQTAHMVKIFQSTPPGWEATVCFPLFGSTMHISIHASRVGGDGSSPWTAQIILNFNPRLPGGRRPNEAGQ